MIWGFKVQMGMALDLSAPNEGTNELTDRTARCAPNLSLSPNSTNSRGRSAKADSNERKATQKIASLKDVIVNQINVLDYRMRTIVELKNQTGTFVHEALAVFQTRLQSDTITMMDKAAHAEQRMGILRDNADVAQAERRSVQKALDAMTETQKITARALELQRVVASQRVLQYTWLHSLRDKAGAIQEPDVRAPTSLG